MSLPLSRVFAQFGKYSYSIYGWHIFVISIALTLNLVWHPYAVGLAVAVVTMALAALSYYVIERPFLELRMRYTKPHPVQEEARLAA